MATGDRRFDGKTSNLLIFGVPAAVAGAVAVLTYQPLPDVPSTDREARIGQPVHVSPRCQVADRASVDQLATLLQRNGPADAAILERAVYTLNMARRHCLYQWDERGLEDYQWLGRWLSEHG